MLMLLRRRADLVDAFNLLNSPGPLSNTCHEIRVSLTGTILSSSDLFPHGSNLALTGPFVDLLKRASIRDFTNGPVT